MNREDIIRMAREAYMQPYPLDTYAGHIVNLETFAALVAAAEREACAKVCDSLNEDFDSLHVESCAEAIRARGES
jgi:hypothetical protein